MQFKKFAITAVLIAALGACAPAAKRHYVVGDYLAGRLAARTNELGDAAIAFSSAYAITPGSEQVLRDAFFFNLASGDVEAAMPFAERLTRLEDANDDGLARVVLAARAIRYENFARARAELSLSEEAGFLTATIKIVDAWATDGVEGAAAALKRLNTVEENAFRGFNPIHEAMLAEKAGLIDEARAAYQIYNAASSLPIGRSAYGAFLERHGDDGAALEFYEALANDPGLGRSAAAFGRARIAAGAPSQAYANTAPREGAAIAFYALGSAILEQTLEHRSAAQRAGFNVGDANYNLPLVMTQIALYLDPDFDEALRFAGSILNAYGDNEGALSLLKRVPRSSPFFEQVQIDIAGAHAALEREDQAIKVLEAAAKADPEATEARYSLANYLASRGRDTEAIKVLDRLIAALPKTPSTDVWRFFVSRGASHLALDNWPAAEADLTRAVEIAPESPTALNYLGYSWAERGINLNEAFALIEKAVSLQPNSGAIIDSLGWAHYQLGDFDEAVGHLEQAAAIEAGDPTITDHLGDVYWRLGRKIEARYQWERVLELEPDEKLRSAVEQKLAEGLAPLKQDGGQ